MVENFRLRLLTPLLVLAGLEALVSCSVSDNAAFEPDSLRKSIVILYENDVHCSINGYARMAGLRDAINRSDTAYAAIVSSGDYLQGAVSGAISRGQYIIDIMRNMNYAAITIGNHEFDYGGPRMIELLQNVNAPVVCANFFEYGATQPFYAPYVIKSYGNKKIAYVGVCTPETMSAESYSFYDKDGNQLYDLRNDQVPALVQQAVDNARDEGADYVVLLSHLGEDEKENAISSWSLVEKTKGIDVVLDGHTHSMIEHHDVTNLEGIPINVTQTGTQFAYVGKLLITADGHISTTLITNAMIPYENVAVAATVDSIKADMSNIVNQPIATTDYELAISDSNGRLVRRGETNLGDLITDAFRSAMTADIGLMNGGGIRNNIFEGTITYGSIIDVLPNDNRICKIEATGALLIEMLRKCTAKCPEEDGNFPQVSGMRYTIHTASHTVSDVEVLDANGTWQPIDETRTYTVGVADYFMNGGYYDILKQCPLLINSNTIVRDVLADYLKLTLGGTTGTAYAVPQQRITIIND
ncbi:MAG: bifunctional metallophosphatase/5'-nucleotidase [Prevotella sp.]|nr:bifunctional metallophosphatase/5'-nucleotidase [Prevotella sp.]